MALLKTHKKTQSAERLKAGDRWTDHDLVFTTRHGGPIERTEDWKQWKAILKQAGVRDVRVHDARHTAATLLIEQGVHIRQRPHGLSSLGLRLTRNRNPNCNPQPSDVKKALPPTTGKGLSTCGGSGI
ncbi:tyrosine-type recombinase/integrase [Nonomuraea montanisoli]|uniref:tyrosine-type recombinase/integrase n=1 Tax=Nonomuraea montanisoli TaxID=2741721 RepID=UPI0038B370EB